MKLLLDIGNTRIKSALLHEHGLTQYTAITHAGLDGEQLLLKITEQLQGQSQPQLQQDDAVDAVWIANVAGAAMGEQIRQAVQRQWQVDSHFVVSSATHGEVRNAYPQPEKLGVDRWLCLLATHAQLGTAQVTLIVSVGTAMTLDALSADGQHRGGLIVPGPDLMISSLLNNTSDIAAHATSGELGAEFFADNTLGAIHQGAARACAALVEAAYRKLAFDESIKVLITGGAANRIVPLVGVPVEAVPDLVLRGLAVLANA